MSRNGRELDGLPRDIWEVNQQLQYDEALSPDDDRWVDTAKARGEFSFVPLFRSLGVDSQKWELRGAPRRSYILFCGHRGCGKSTELRRVHKQLDRPELFLAIFLDAAKALDPNNLQYQDVLLALAEALLSQLGERGIELDQVHLGKLQSWFDERLEKHEATREFAVEVKAGAKAEAGIPFLTKLFADVTTAFRQNSTYKEELRRVVRNHFSEFSEAFNQLIQAAEQACEEGGAGQAYSVHCRWYRPLAWGRCRVILRQGCLSTPNGRGAIPLQHADSSTPRRCGSQRELHCDLQVTDDQDRGARR